jgi:MFS family permease
MPTELSISSAASTARLSTWRTPFVIVGFGCLISLIAFGPRSTFGFFLTPMSSAHHWGRDVFAFALALQNLLWGGQANRSPASSPTASARRACFPPALSSMRLGLVLMTHATNEPMLDLSAGVLLGFGLSGSSFMVILAAFGKLLPPQHRSLAFGAGTAAGSFGQFLYSPIAVLLMDQFGWQQTLTIFAVSMMAVLPLSLALATPKTQATKPSQGKTLAAPQSLRQALGEALGHRSYMLCWCSASSPAAFSSNSSPCTCRPISIDRGLSATIGGWTIAAIGLFNIIGSLASGWLGDRMPKRYLLSIIYFGRAAAILAFIWFPVTPFSCIAFGATMGLMWLSTVPPTNGIIARPVRHAMAGDFVRSYLFQPPGRRLSRRLARRHRVRSHRFLRCGLVAGDLVRRPLGADQPADRGKAGCRASPTMPA